jgi:hypothetical protein
MSNRILSYRSLLENDGQDTILLSTKKGEIGYRIKKLEIFPNQPGAVNSESIIKLYSEEQSGVDALVDFSDNRLLGAAYYTQYNAPNTTANTIVTTFDYKIFNQDIYITFKELSGTNQSCNYYLELEMIKLDESQAMVATLTDIRNNS